MNNSTVDLEIAFRLVLFGLLILMSGFFSGSETAMFSISRVQLMRLREELDPRAGLLERLLSQPRRLIATIFIGNEFVTIGASALMASVSHHYFASRGSAVVTAVSTGVSVVLILFVGEITPKNIAAQLGERWALAAARPIKVLAFFMAPLRWLIERIADAVVHLVGDHASNPDLKGVGEEEFRTMVDVAGQGGELNEGERRLIHNVFDFGDRRVTEVMTPAKQVFALNYNLSLARLLAEIQSNRYSRVPIYQGTREKIVGVLYAKDLIAVMYGIGREHRRLQDLLHPAYFIPKATKCEQLLREFRRRRTHQALVVDEYGKFIGLITMEDLLEEMFGEMRDEKDLPRPTGEMQSVSGV